MSVTEENVIYKRKLIEGGSRLTYHHTLGLNASTIRPILKDHLHVQLGVCLEMLIVFSTGQSQCVNNIVTGYQTWV